GAGGIDGVDAVHPAVEDRRALVDLLRIGAVRRVELGGDRELATPQNALEPPPRRMAWQRIERQMDALWIFVGMGRAACHVVSLAFSRSAAASAVTRSHAEVSRSDWSTGFCTARIASPCLMLREPSHALTQTHGMSGSTSQLPFARTPPQGPFLSCFGQFIGQDMPVEDRMHWPHMRQSNMKPFTRFSTN